MNGIAIVGGIATGKGEMASLCKLLTGMETYSLSNVLRTMLLNKGVTVNRENLIELGHLLRRERGEAILAELLLAQAGKNEIIVESVRSAGEAKYLATQGFVVLGIQAPLDLRWVWYQKRLQNRSEDEGEFTKFMWAVEQEEEQIKAALAECSSIYTNEIDLVFMREWVESRLEIDRAWGRRK
jgi:dephospho-CoA kinase